MPSYVILFQFTDQGIRKIKDSPARVEAAKKICRNLGGEVKQFYGLMGNYDTLFILEAPGDEAAVKMAATIAMQGNVRTHTMRAFTETEYREMLSALPS